VTYSSSLSSLDADSKSDRSRPSSCAGASVLTFCLADVASIKVAALLGVVFVGCVVDIAVAAELAPAELEAV